MSSGSSRKDLDTQDGEILADLFDDLLQEILEGRTPDLDQYVPDRPDLRDRVAKTWALACSVAGRREASRPVLGGYEILRELGHGGMGTVYLAQHEILQREVAIKVLPHSLAMSPRAKQRFLEEAKALAQIRHDNVVHIHRVLDHTEMLAFEMEYIDGPSLRHVVQELRSSDETVTKATLARSLGLPVETLAVRNPIEWFVRAGIKIARALGEVHRHGLVHRDIKPSNILLRANGTPVLADFGLARIGELGSAQTGDFAGTPVYAAPERLRGGDGEIGPQTDIYSLGVTLYELLTLSPPFSGQSTREVLRRIESGRLPDIRQEAPHVSRDLATVVQKAMESDPRHRYASADEFADDLERLLNLEPIRARPAGPVRASFKFMRRNQRVVTAGLIGAIVVAAVAWPIAAHAQANHDAKIEADRRLHLTRTALLAPESLHTAWTLAFGGTGHQPLQNPRARAAHIDALERVVSGYDSVLDVTPDNAAVRLERNAVQGALAVARRSAGESNAPLGRSTPSERFAAGLHGFLIGDPVASQACWSELSGDFEGHALLDACQALQLANEGFPEQSYPRLFHATRAFPESAALALSMAAAALEMGDTQFAEEWLRRTPEHSENHILGTRRRLLAADLHAAKSEYNEAASIYRELSAREVSDPMPLQRLAALAIVEGNSGAARRMLERVLTRWPDQARSRLLLAQLDLQQRRLADYLAHVRHVLAQDLDTLPRTAANHLAEIPRFGGLSLGAKTDHRWRHPSHRILGLPLANWLSPQMCNAIDQVMPVVGAFDRALDTARRIDTRPIGAVLRATWHNALSLPNAMLLLPTVAQVTVLTIPAWLGKPTDWATEALMPFQTILGNRTIVVQPEAVVPFHEEPPNLAYARITLRTLDVDGDTLADFCIASSAAPTNTTPGRVELRSASDGTLLRTLIGSDDSLRFARGLAVISDIDGDHCQDLLIGSTAAEGNEGTRGIVALFSGRTGEPIWTHTDRGSWFGASIAALDDIDGDGQAEFVVGSPASMANETRGQAFLCSGKTGAILGTFAPEEAPTAFGGKVANVGDVDADGMDDFLVTGNRGNSKGFAVVYSSRTSKVLATFAEESALDDFGIDAIGLGDINRDGHADFAISAPAYTGRNQQTGRVLVLDGKTGKMLHEQRGEQRGESFGMAMCSLPYWRDDGRPAIAISAFRGGPTGQGYVRIFDAETGQPLQTLAANPSIRLLGQSLFDLGDQNGDGLRDLGVPLILGDDSCGVWSVSFALTLGR